MTDLDHSPESDQALVVDLMLAQQFGAVPVFRWQRISDGNSVLMSSACSQPGSVSLPIK